MNPQDWTARLQVDFLHGYLDLRKADLTTRDGSRVHIYQDNRGKHGGGFSTICRHRPKEAKPDIPDKCDYRFVTVKSFRGIPCRTEQSRFISALKRALE